MDEVKIKCDALLDKYSLTEISKLTCIDISTVCRILKSHLNEKTPKEYSWKLSDELIDEVKDFSKLQGPKLPCSCQLHTLPRLRASQRSNLCEATSRRYRG